MLKEKRKEKKYTQEKLAEMSGMEPRTIVRIEKDETDEEAVRREVIEEAGYSITDIKYFDNISSYCWSEKNGYMDIVATIYTGKFDEKVAVPIEEDHKVIWVNPEEYKDKLYHEYQRYILNKYISTKKGIYSE